MTNPTPSPETQKEAMNIAKVIQKSGQSKETTKLIAQGIEKGIAHYKKLQKGKARDRDKERKKLIKVKNAHVVGHQIEETVSGQDNSTTNSSTLPWVLLVLSWAGFAGYILFVG